MSTLPDDKVSVSSKVNPSTSHESNVSTLSNTSSILSSYKKQLAFVCVWIATFGLFKIYISPAITKYTCSPNLYAEYYEKDNGTSWLVTVELRNDCPSTIEWIAQTNAPDRLNVQPKGGFLKPMKKTWANVSVGYRSAVQAGYPDDFLKFEWRYLTTSRQRQR